MDKIYENALIQVGLNLEHYERMQTIYGGYWVAIQKCLAIEEWIVKRISD